MTTTTTGAIKSSIYVMVLTFFLPVASVQLSNTFLVEVAHGGDRVSALLSGEAAAADQLISDCPERSM